MPLTTLKTFTVGAALLAATAPATANLIVNGDFEGGDSGFSSDYTAASISSGPATYVVIDDPNTSFYLRPAMATTPAAVV